MLIHAYWSRHKTWGLLGALDDNDVEKISSIVKDIKVVNVNSIHDVHLAKPKIFIKAVNDFLQSLDKEFAAKKVSVELNPENEQ